MEPDGDFPRFPGPEKKPLLRGPKIKKGRKMMSLG